VTSGTRTIVYPVKDLDDAKAVYASLLVVQPYTDEPWYVGFRVGDQELGLDPHGHSQGMTGPVGNWHVEDIRGSVQQLLDAGGRRGRRSGTSGAAGSWPPSPTPTATSPGWSSRPERAVRRDRAEAACVTRAGRS